MLVCRSITAAPRWLGPHHPLHVVVACTGHSLETIRKIDLQVTDKHREKALKV